MDLSGSKQSHVLSHCRHVGSTRFHHCARAQFTMMKANSFLGRFRDSIVGYVESSLEVSVARSELLGKD